MNKHLLCCFTSTAILTAPVEPADREDKERRRRDRKNATAAELEAVTSAEVAIENKWRMEDPVSRRKFGGSAQRSDEQDTSVLLVFDESTSSFFFVQPEQLHMKNEAVSRWKTVEDADAYMAQRNRTAGKVEASRRIDEDASSTSNVGISTSSSSTLGMRDTHNSTSNTPSSGSARMTLADLAQQEEDENRVSKERRRAGKPKQIKTDTEYARFDDDEGAVADYISDQELAEDDEPKERSYKKKMEERNSAKKLGMVEYDAEEVDADELATNLTKKVLNVYDTESEADETSDSSSDETEMTDKLKNKKTQTPGSQKNPRAVDASTSDVEQELKRVKLESGKSAPVSDARKLAGGFKEKLTKEFLFKAFSAKAAQLDFSPYEVSLTSMELFLYYWPNVSRSDVPREDAMKFHTFIMQECRVVASGNTKTFFLHR